MRKDHSGMRFHDLSSPITEKFTERIAAQMLRTHGKGSVTEEPCARKRCAAGRGAASLTQSRGVRRETPGSSTYLRAKAGGDKSMSEKRESLEGVYGAVPQDPRDMVKATLPESQSPVVEPHTHRYHASDAVLSRACRSSFAVRTLRVMDDVQRAHSRG